jgi:penicillin amidase
MLQNDNYNMMASEGLPVLMSILNGTDTTAFSSQEKNALKILTAWNFVNNKDSEASSYFEAWWDHFIAMLWDEMYMNSDYKLYVPSEYITINLLKEKNSSITDFYDSKKTEQKENQIDIILHSFKVSVASIEDWKNNHKNNKVRWADYKDTYVRHLARIESLGEHVQHGGNHDIVNASSRTKGPSWRMVVSMEKAGLKAFAVYPGGQSGNPGSAYYTDMLDNWSNGRYFRLIFPVRPEAMEGKVLFPTVLNPKKK